MDNIEFIDNIYEVSVGTDPKTDIRYTKGRRYKVGNKEVQITEILYDATSFEVHGARRILLYAVEVGEEEDFLWKVLEAQPFSMTRDIG